MIGRALAVVRDKLKGKPARMRSRQWGRVKKEHKRHEPACRACGSTVKVEVHHIVPFHVMPELELVPTNLVTLCESRRGFKCHFVLGHFMDYRHWNDNVVADADKLREDFFLRLSLFKATRGKSA